MRINGSINRASSRVALISTHGYVAANPPLGAADTGGQVVYVLELGKKLAQLGYDVDIFTRQFEEQPRTDHINDNLRVIRFPCGGRDFIPKEYLYRHLDDWCASALAFVRESNRTYSFINSHYWDGGVAGQTMANALSVPHIHTPHSLGAWKMKQMLQDYPSKASAMELEFNFSERIQQEMAIYAACEHLVATTPMQVEALTQDYIVAGDRISMIPPGYDDNRFFPVSPPSRQAIRQRLDFQGKVVLALGRLATNKGYDLLIDAFGVLAAREPDVVLNLAVGGDQMDADEHALLHKIQAKVGELGLTGKVKFSGYIPDEELADYYRAADLFVLPSRYEPFGMTAVEAMACGTPTVVTTHGGLFQAVNYGRHALFADPFDRYDFGITMMKPLRHEKLSSRLSTMGAHKARSLFTWTGIAQQIVSISEGHPPSMAFHDNDWAEPWQDGD